MASATTAATRQQLDELDALLQKMLGPSASNDPPAAPAPKPVEKKRVLPEPPAPSRFPAPEVAFGMPPAATFAANAATSVAAPNTDTAAPPNKPNWGIELNPRGGSSVLGNRSPVAGTGWTNDPPISPAMAASPLNVTPIAPLNIGRSLNRDEPPIPLLLKPFAALDRGFDCVVSNYLPLGRLIASPSARGFLGYSGLAMISASAAWFVLTWTGWSW